MSAIVKTRDEWLAERKKHVGASEVATILGLSHWRSPYSLWAEKVGLGGNDDESEAQEWGQLLEEPIARKYSATTGRELIDHGRFNVRPHASAPLACTLDREIVQYDERGPGALEIKTAGIFKADDWTDGAPLLYQVQVQAQLAVTGWSWGSAAVLIGGQRFRWCDVARNDAFIAVMLRKVEEFWTLVEKETPPPVDGSEPTSEILRRLYPRDNGEVIALPGEARDWTEQYDRACEVIKKAEADKREAQNKIIAAIGEATTGVMTDGTKWTYRTQERKASTVGASTFRVLRKAR